MATTWTFTPHAGIGTLVDASVVVNGSRFDVDQALIDGGGSIVTTDSSLARELMALRVEEGPLFDVNGVVDSEPELSPVQEVRARLADLNDGDVFSWDQASGLAVGSPQAVGNGSGLPSTIQSKTGAYTAAAGDLVKVDATASAVPIALPASPSTGALVTVVKTDSSTNAVTVVASGGGTINGDTDASLDSQDATIIAQHLGSNAWRIVSMFATGSEGASSLVAADLHEIVVFGHSFAAGSLATGDLGYTTTASGKVGRVCRALGAKETNKAVGGSKIGANNNAGSWLAVPTYFAHAPREVVDDLSARAQVVSMDWGINDNGAGAVVQASIQNAMRAVVAMSRMATRFQGADTSVTTTGGTLQAANAIYSGDRTVAYNANGNTVTVTVPSWFPGGEVCLYFLASDAKGGILTSTVDGVAAGSPGPLDLTASQPAVGSFVIAVQRFTGLAAGAHTIVATLSGKLAGGAPYFDSWTMQAASPPLIVVHNVTPTGSDGAPVQHADLNGYLSTVVGEFDDHVVIFDRASLFMANFDVMLAIGDTTHPGDYGHSVIAKGMVDLLAANADKIPSPSVLLTA